MFLIDISLALDVILQTAAEVPGRVYGVVGAAVAMGVTGAELVRYFLPRRNGDKAWQTEVSLLLRGQRDALKDLSATIITTRKETAQDIKDTLTCLQAQNQTLSLLTQALDGHNKATAKALDDLFTVVRKEQSSHHSR